ncbi:MAG: hypothetical protein P8I11_03920 [Bacteroidia bacterium]|nr:hypothetical protein [Bacteroidia bacterium]
MYNEELEKLIEMALMDDVLTEKEKQILFKKAEKLGVDLDEFEMVLDAKIFEKQKDSRSAISAPKSDKLGDVKKCPACGAIAQSFATKCADCGTEFRNIDASQNITKFFEKLDELESNRKDVLFNSTEDKSGFSVSTILKWWIFWWILLPLKFINFIANKSKPTKWSTTDSRKEEMIMNFPVPNSREEIIEFISLSVSKIKQVSIIKKFDEEGKYISKWNSIWKKKAEQVFIKAKLSMKDDLSTIKSIEQILLDARIIKAKK